MEWQSAITVEAKSTPGVRFRVRRTSLGRRIELSRTIHEMSRRLEFKAAGLSPQEEIEAAWLSGAIDGACLRWGLEAVEGLTIDGEAATVDSFVERGPESLAREALAAVRAEAFLTEDDRKN